VFDFIRDDVSRVLEIRAYPESRSRLRLRVGLPLDWAAPGETFTQANPPEGGGAAALRSVK
jgi:hypothetical protein